MSTPKIVIYTADNCPYCIIAKKLLDSKGLSYSEINIANDSEKRKALMQRRIKLAIAKNLKWLYNSH